MADTHQSTSPLRPSAAMRWLNCPMSHRLSKYFTSKEETDAARFGTAAHEEAERLLRKKILGEKLTVRKKAHKEALAEFAEEGIEQMVESYVTYVTQEYNKAVATDTHTMIWFELQVDLSDIAPNLSGTADVVIYQPEKQHLLVLDLKTGHLEVDAENNPQLKLYSHGVRCTIEKLGLTVTSITNVIYLPRIDVVKQVDVGIYGLEDFIKEAKTSAHEALTPNTMAGKPGPYCRYCPAKQMCRLRAANAYDYFKGSPDDPALLDNEDIEVLLDVVKDIASWARDIEERAKDVLAMGGDFQNWEMAEGTSRRYISNIDDLVSIFEKKGLNSDMIYKEREIKGITELDKLIPRDELETVTARAVGKPRLVKKKEAGRQFVIRASSNIVARSLMQEIHEKEKEVDAKK